MSPDKATKKQILFICVFLVVTTLIVFWQVTQSDFINFDDTDYVTENHHVQKGLDPKEVAWAFTSPCSHNWFPLTMLSYMLDFQLFGMQPAGFHTVNLFLHIINALLLFLFFRKMTGGLWPSAFAATLFAIHPLHVESVAWVAERKDVLSTFFFMLTIWLYVLYTEKPEIKKYLITILFFILGIMSKPMLITLPFVLLLLDFWPLGLFSEAQSRDFRATKTYPLKINLKKKHKKEKVVKTIETIKQQETTFRWQAIFPLIREKIPFFLITVMSIIITLYAQRGIVKSMELYPLHTRIANAIVTYVSYIGKMFWPDNLAIFYPYGSNLGTWQVLGGIILLVSISVIIAILRKPYLIVGWLWYIGTLIPVIGLVQVGLQARADRYTYIPLIGIFIILAWGASGIAEHRPQLKKGLSLIGWLIVITLGTVTWLQVATWKNCVTLFHHAIEVTSNNYWAHNSFGLCLSNQGDYEHALNHYQESLRIKPRQEDILNNIGLIMAINENNDSAISCFSEALRINPNYAKAHINWGSLLFKMGRNDEVIFHTTEALRIDSNDPVAHYLLGVSLANVGQADKAILHLSETLRLAPNQLPAHNALGVMLLEKGQIDEAINHFRQALLINPEDKETRKNIQIAIKLKKNAQGN